MNIQTLTVRDILLKWNAEALVQRRIVTDFASHAGPHRFLVPDFGDFVKSLVDEDHRYQDSETFLGESSDVSDKCAEIKGHHDEKRHHHPDPDPESKRHEFQIVVSE